MKKWAVIFVSILVMAVLMGCTVQSTTELDTMNEPDEPSTNDAPDNIEEIQASIAQEHLFTLYDIIEKVGFMTDDMEFYMGEYYHGLMYAKVIDFNNDGVDELVTLVKGSAYNLDEDAAPYNAENYVFEVWATDYNTYSPAFVKEIAVDECSACDLSLRFALLADGTTVILESAAQTAQGTTFYNGTYFVMDKAGSFTAKKFSEEYGEEIVYFVEDKKVEEDSYRKAESEFEGEVEWLIEGNMGTKAFVYEELSAGKMVADIYEAYDQYTAFDEIAQQGEEVEPYLIQGESEFVKNIDTVDVNDKSVYTDMISHVILYGNAYEDSPGRDMYYGISEEAVAAGFEEMFGEPLHTEDINFPGFDAIGNYDYNTDILYEDGVFYVLPVEFNTWTVIRTINRAVQVKEDMYYIEVYDTEYDAFGHYTVRGDMTYDEQEAYIYEPVESWPADARQFAKSNVPRYMLMRIDEGGWPRFLYIGYRPLTLEQVQSYQ
jgi:hypothetical protein